MCTLHANLCTFIIIPPWILFRMKIISEELFKETQNKKFLGSIHCFTPKKILHLWENVEIYGRVQLKCDGTRWHREGKWRGNWWIECVASTLHTTSEHGVFSIIIAKEPTSAASSRLNWRTPDDLNRLVRFVERRNMVSARVPSHFNWPVQPDRPQVAIYSRVEKMRFCMPGN